MIAPLLAVLSAAEFSPVAVLATLRTLNSVADSLSLEHSPVESSENGLHNLLYTEQHLSSVAQLLLQASLSLTVQQQISMAAALITKTCHEEAQRKLLAQAGILEALASRLSSFVIATGCYFVRSGCNPDTATTKNLPTATTKSRLAPILEAVGTIIKDSKPRAIQFLSAPALAAVFPTTEFDATSNYERKANAWSSHFVTSFANRQMPPNPIEALLPQLPSLHYRGSLAQTSNFPPLGAVGATGKQSQLSRTVSSAIEVIQNQACDFAEDDENPLISWLIYIVRAEGGITRLMAAWVLAIFYRVGLANRRRETGFALLLIPLLVRMLDKDLKESVGVAGPYESSALRSSDWIMKEQAPAVLAMLAVDSLELQRAAVDAGAIKKLSQLLKESYDPLPTSFSTSLWTPQPPYVDNTESKASASKLGALGLSPSAYHVTRMRETVLVALAALASLKDEYRKAIIDNGVVPLVIESLKPFNTPSSASEYSKTPVDEASKNRKALTGNPNIVILAACGAARGLSRSVSTLRTSLMDAGLAAPLFVLLRNQDTEIQVAATAVICNLVLEFSPMRDVGCLSSCFFSAKMLIISKAIIEAGILKILCEHAHSVNASLRLNSVWALKHLVLTAPNSLKKTCLEELGPSWLKQIISSDSEDFKGDKDIGLGTPIAMGTPNAAGEQVDLLNAVDKSRESSQAFDDEGEEDLKMVDSIGALSRSGSDHKSNSIFSSRCNGRQNSLETSRWGNAKDGESNSPNQSRTEDLAIQKEGLDFIRNLICGPGAPDMIDYMFSELGQDKIFDMLAGKLRGRVLHAFNRDRRLGENGVKHLAPQPEIITSVCYIIVHIAAGSPKHRQLLISQPELLKLLVPLFTHTHREVRGCCAWLVINLTWVDDQSDHLNCKARARELVQLGIYEQLQMLGSDSELDVRERTKTAIHQMSQLLR